MNASGAAWLAGGMLAVAPFLPAQVAAVPPPVRFERVLWCADVARGAPVAANLGCTAVQVGRGVDPGPALAAGLGFYLDQPIGKGLLELRDAEWQPVRDGYERTRDAAAVRRPGCLSTPGLVADAARAAAAEALRLRGPGLRFIALADEASATRHDAPLDPCHCEHCLAEFRRFAARRCGDVATLNRMMGTQFASIAAAVPPSTDAVRRRELGDVALPADLRGWSLGREFADEQFAAAVAAIAVAVQAVAPEVPIGLTGLAVPAAFGGNDPARLLPGLTLAEPYDVGGACELARCLLPSFAHRYATLAPPDAAALGPMSLRDHVRARLAAMACQGLAGVVLWNDGTVAGADGGRTPFGEAVRAAFAVLGPALDACAGAQVESGAVWLVESQPSVRTWWMLDSAGDGMTWTRRLQSYERAHSTSQAARTGWIRLLQDLGQQPHFVAAAALPERLLQRRPRCLVLPATIALADRAAQAITAYVQQGGVVLADHSTGLYDDDLQRRPAGALDALFGIEQRSLRWDDLRVRGGGSTARPGGLPLAEHGLRGRIAERRDAGDAHVEHGTGRGRAVYLNAPVAAYGRWRLDAAAVEPARELRRRVRAVLQRAGVEPPCELRGEGLPTCIERTVLRLRDGRSVLAIRLHALEAPAILQQIAAAGPRPVVVELPAPRTLRHLGGESLGTGTRFELQLDAFGALLLEVAP